MKRLLFDGAHWQETDHVDVPAPAMHALWMGSSVFDGARSLSGHLPDLNLHCARLNASAERLGLRPTMNVDSLQQLCLTGVRRFPVRTELYMRLLYFAQRGDGLLPDAESTAFAIVIDVAPVPRRARGLAVALSPYCRPDPRSAPADAKASCLYPIGSMALAQARSRGFDNAVMLDLDGAVAELTSANIFFVKNGMVHTPAGNGSFLLGVTRRRCLALFRQHGLDVSEGTYTFSQLQDADEVFSTGNFEQVQPITRLDEREMPVGPLTTELMRWNREYIANSMTA